MMLPRGNDLKDRLKSKWYMWVAGSVLARADCRYQAKQKHNHSDVATWQQARDIATPDRSLSLGQG